MAAIKGWKGLVRYYHVLLSRLGMSHEEGSAMVAENYKVEHLSELSYQQLSALCNLLAEQLKKMNWMQDDTPTTAADIKRKQQKTVKAACGHLLAVQGKIPPKNWGPNDWDVIMGTICNASGKKEFDSLTTQELRALSFEFNKQRKALEALQAPNE